MGDPFFSPLPYLPSLPLSTLISRSLLRDSSRSKYTIGAGLPKKFSVDEVKRVDQDSLGSAQWIYTGGPNNEFIFAMGGHVRETWVAKYDALTLTVIQHIILDPGLYLGGLLIHQNGHVYCVQSNTLHRFWFGDLLNSTSLRLPSDLNSHGVIQTNGMVVTHDGYLAIKQWPYIIEDMAILIFRFKIISQLAVAFLILTFTIAIATIPKKKFKIQKVLQRLMLSLIVCGLVCVMIACGVIYKLSGPFDVFKFVFSGWAWQNGSGGGELKLIDPLTLEIKAEIKLHERCSYARMAMTTFPETGEDVFVLLGDEWSHQYRWNGKTGKLYEVPNWSRRYRQRYTGTFPGTGPAIFNQTVYYTDNTYPVGLSGNSYSIFRQTLFTEQERAAVAPLPPDAAPAGGAEASTFTSQEIFHSDRISPPNTPGFMFWSITISPLVNNLLVWDTANSLVQSRHTSNLTINWEVHAVQLDCLTIAADKGHVYFSDYNKRVEGGANSWFSEMFIVPNATKYLIVADVETGEVMLNMTVSEGEGLKPSLIVPGAHDDVIIGTPTGISRLYV
jgi:hypothetical protein